MVYCDTWTYMYIVSIIIESSFNHPELLYWTKLLVLLSDGESGMYYNVIFAVNNLFASIPKVLAFCIKVITTIKKLNFPWNFSCSLLFVYGFFNRWMDGIWVDGWLFWLIRDELKDCWSNEESEKLCIVCEMMTRWLN